MRSAAAVLVVTMLTGPAMGYAAQQPPNTDASGKRQASGVPPSASPAGNAPRELPVSVERIRRKLAQAPRTKRDGLRLEYYVEVYGKAPRIELFANFNPVVGPVRYGSPTHQEFLDLVTPQEFRSPAGDLLSPIAALVKWLSDRQPKKKSDPNDRR